MIIAPVGGSIKASGPDAVLAGTGRLFLAPIVAGGDREAFGDQDCAKIVAADRAAGEQAVVLILVFGDAVHRARSEKRGHAVAGFVAAGPVAAVGPGARLGKFGRVEPQEANPVVAEAEAVAVTGPGLAGHRRWWRVELRGHQRQHSQNHNGQQRTTAAGKDAVSVGLSTQDFTAR
jgi:hypothetical protein